MRKKCLTMYRNFDTKTKYLREREREGREKFAKINSLYKKSKET